ncbi:uncharacterized protein LOC109855679 [Pseudomyrmex gracilis]|uniref:uncharacterized protein LOC109855679 n=1 Tax=Pseudomyrmex gracilis TaxID=219809 RepID=UPI0009958DC1|nr:uncharacterized protein LOC109855679 [Pseudomyrmex gracilis]
MPQQEPEKRNDSPTCRTYQNRNMRHILPTKKVGRPVVGSQTINSSYVGQSVISVYDRLTAIWQQPPPPIYTALSFLSVAWGDSVLNITSAEMCFLCGCALTG